MTKVYSDVFVSRRQISTAVKDYLEKRGYRVNRKKRMKGDPHYGVWVNTRLPEKLTKLKGERTGYRRGILGGHGHRIQID